MAVWIKVLALMDKSISLDYQGIHLLSVCSELKQTWRNLLLCVYFASIALIAKLHHYFDYQMFCIELDGTSKKPSVLRAESSWL